MSINDDLLESERKDRERRQTMIARYRVRDAINSLSSGHPAVAKLEEALALLETN